MMKQRVYQLAALLFGILFMAAVCLFDWDSINSYQAYNTSSLSYVRGRVVSVDRETLELDASDESRYLGEQEITVEILEGEWKGRQVEIDNYLTQIHNVHTSKGQTIIVCADAPEEAEPYFTVFNYDRTLPLGLLAGTFVLAVLLVGRSKGLRALLGVAYTLFTVVFFLVQAIYHGFSPVGTVLLTILIATGASLLLLNGFSRRTAVGVLSTLAGVGVTAALFVLFSALLHLSGYNMDAAESLLLISSSTGLSVKYVLLAGVLVSALGAVMDVAVSLTAALEELVLVRPETDRRELIRSGFHIGKDMIGTMSNTLILAYAGTALNTMLCLLAYGYQFRQLISSDYLAVELAQGLCATLGVVLTVPITTAISALVFVRTTIVTPPPKKGADGESDVSIDFINSEQNKRKVSET